MTFPVIYAEIEFGKGPFDGDAGSVTVDVPLLKRVTTKSGRTNELEATPAGAAELTLDNADRRYDPFDTAGPWYNELLPNRKVTIYMTDGGGDRVLWTGWTEDWPQSYSPPETADVILPCVDALGVVARAAIPDSVWVAAVKAAIPLAWYRMDETNYHIMFDSSGNDYHGQYDNGIHSSTTGLLVGDANLAVNFEPSTHIGKVVYDEHPEVLPRPTAGGTPRLRTYAFWWQGEIIVDNSQSGVVNKINEFRLLACGYGTVPNEDSLEVLYDDLTGICFRTRDGTEQAADLGDYSTDTPHFIVVHYPASTATTDLQIWMDGVPVTTVTYSRTPKPSPLVLAYGEQGTMFGANGMIMSDGIEDFDSGLETEVIIDEVCVYDRALSDPEVLELYEAGHAPWDLDDPIDRLNHVLGFANLTAFETVTAPFGDWVLGPVLIQGVNPLDYLQRIEATEVGRLVCPPDGTIDLLPREEFPDPLSVAAAFTDDPAGDLHYDDVEFDTGTTFLRNQVTVVYEPGLEKIVSWQPGFVQGECTVTDDASVALYGPRPFSTTTVLHHYDDARALALDILSRSSTPTPRVTKLVINPAGDAGLIDIASTLKLGDRVTVERHPQGLGSSFTLACHIDGIEHEIDNGVDVWKVTYYMSAAATV